MDYSYKINMSLKTLVRGVGGWLMGLQPYSQKLLLPDTFRENN